MTFSNDRDLLAIEPSVFADVPFAAQKRLSVSDAAVSGTTLISATADFVASGVGAGDVVLVGGVAHEVLERAGANSLEVSLPRAKTSDPGIPGGDGTNLELVVCTFGPQAELVHDGLLRMIGFDPDDPEPVVTESAVVSVDLLRRIEALGTLEVVYSGAASLIGDNDALLMKADTYRRRFKQACNRAVVLLDKDGDGLVDERVPLGNIRLKRV